jgi:hypothetical protein
MTFLKLKDMDGEPILFNLVNITNVSMQSDRDGPSEFISIGTTSNDLGVDVACTMPEFERLLATCAGTKVVALASA